MPDQPYDEARTLAHDLVGNLPQSILQRHLRLGLQDATALLDRLSADGHIDADARDADHHRTRALDAYAQALTGCALYEQAEHGGNRPLHGWASHQDAKSPPMPAPQP